MLAYFLQLLADDRSVVISLHRHQLHSAVGKIQYLERAGVGNQLLDILGYQLLRADDHIDRNVLTAEQLFLVGQVLGRAHPGDFGGGVEQGMGHLAGHHIDLVTVGDCDQHIGVFGAGLEQGIGMGCTAGNCAYIQPVLQQPQLFTIGINHSNVILFIGEVFCQGATDLAGAKNNDLHRSGSSSSINRCGLPEHIKENPRRM